jgi:hypothetical protein
MTANRQRHNPVACRTCGHVDRNAECYICSACALNVCSGCVAVLRRRWIRRLARRGRWIGRLGCREDEWTAGYGQFFAVSSLSSSSGAVFDIYVYLVPFGGVGAQLKSGRSAYLGRVN